MAVTITNLANNISTSDDFSTGSVAWAAGSRGVVFVASSNDGGPINFHSVSGGGVTWTEIGHQVYASRRGISVLVSDGTPSDGALTIGAGETGTYQETQWSVEQIEGFDSAQWPSTSTEAENPGNTASLNAPDVGTIDAGDLVVFGVGFEDGADNLAPASGSSQHVLRGAGGNVRSLLVATSTTDDTPGASWDSTGNGAGLVAILIKATVAGGDISAVGSLSVTGAADLGATGSLGAAGALSITGAADLDAVGSLSAAGAVSITGAASLTGAVVNDISASGSLAISGAAVLDATGALAAAGAVAITGAADLNAAGSLAAAGSVSVSGTADLDATGSLSAVGSLAINGVAELTEADNPNITAAGSLSISAVAALNALGQLSAAGSVSITGTADLEYPNELQAVGSLLISGSADLDASGALTAAGQIAILGAAVLVDANAGSPPVRKSRSKRLGAGNRAVKLSASNREHRLT